MNESDTSTNFEAILKIYSEKKPLGLYNAKEKHSTFLSSEVLKPKDVIASVSKQLRDIQKADSLKKDYVKDIVKAKQSDFVPINVSSQEGFHHLHFTNFETQCVTDTQLIDIVDNVEAMVNVNMSQDFPTTFCPVQDHSNKKTTEESHNINLCGEHSNTITENNNNRDLNDAQQFHNKKTELCIPEKKTDIYSKFGTSYNATNSDKKSTRNNKILIGTEHFSKNIIFSKLDTVENIENSVAPMNKDDCIEDNIIRNYISPNITEETIKLDKDKYNICGNNIQSEFGYNTVNNFSNYSDLDSKFDDIIPVKQKVPNSPIFKSSKLTSKCKSPSPIIFPLDSFEKFESFAMPLIEKNTDFEAVKHVINSQIIDNQLLISANVVPTLKKCTINKHNDSNKELLENNNDIEIEMSNDLKEMNKSTNLEDEILFSSDEENDFHHRSKFLPLTCAIRSSFNEPEIDLNETIFVGFQTSNNKCIQVSKDSFFKAQNMFASIDQQKNYNLTVTELVDIYDSNIASSNNNLSSEQISVKECNTNKNVNNFTVNTLNTHDSLKVFKQTEFIGLKTSNDKSIRLSEKLVPMFKTLSKDMEKDLNDSIENVPLSNALTKNKEHNKIFNMIDSNLCNTMLDIKRLDLEIKSNGRAKIHQQDVKGQPSINYDCSNIEDQTLLQEFENDSIEEFLKKDIQTDCNELQALESTTSETEIKNTPVILRSNKEPLNHKDGMGYFEIIENFDPGITEYLNIPEPQACPIFFGFKTGNNKEIKVSNEALAKTKDLFHDIEFEDIGKQKRYTDNTFKFSSEINDLNKYTNVRDFIECDAKCKSFPSESNNPPPFYQGFKTASNKIVKISKQALLKSKEVFRDVDTNGVSKNILSENEGDSEDDIMLLSNKSNTYNPFPYACAFKTAKENPVIISKEASNKTKKIFQDMINDIDVQNIGQTQGILNSDKRYSNISKAMNLNSKCSNSVSNVTEPENITNIDNFRGFHGFKTANNKPIIVSEESLLKTRQIFEFIDNSDNKKEQYKTAESEIFNVITATETSNKNKSMHNVGTSKTLGFQGFKTASGKQLAISDDALAKTKFVFKDIDCETNVAPNDRQNERLDNYKTDIEIVSDNVFEVVRRLRNETNMGDFQGFKTASNKEVMISNEAVAKTRKIFQEINFGDQSYQQKLEKENDFVDENINMENKCSKKNVLLNFGFKTANNKSNKVSKNKINKSRQVFSDLDHNFMKIKKNMDEKLTNEVVIDTKNNLNLDNIINTQLLNNFEQTLYTEDFHSVSSPKQSKRSGSPILSCPKAKKRKKFETPYRSGTRTANIQKVVYRTNKKSEAKYTFSENYKKCKLYSLNELAKSDKSEDGVIIDPYILNFEFETLLNFEFVSIRNELANVSWNVDNIKTCFVESVDNRIIPEGWLNNHLKLILWKLISYEIRFPRLMQSVCSVRNILEQLKYRYDKELYRVERPILRKLFEKDDISTKTMILAVVGVYVDGVKVQSVTNPTTTFELLLTDGWYCIKACTDRMITRLVSEGKIAVGKKIATVGAELLGCEQGVSPWEDTSSVRLKLFGNSTRPACWDTRLGCYAKGTIMSRLSTIDPSGGKVCKTRVVITRVYPMMYVEKLEDGSTVTRSERLENLHQMKYETERQNQLEKLYEEVEKEFFDQETSESEGVDTDIKKNHLSGSQLSRLMKKSRDLSQFRAHLTDSQALLLQEYSSKKKDKVVEELQTRVQEKIRLQGLHVGRNVIPLLKIRVADIEETDSVKVSKAMISIWRPNDAILEVVKEGAWIDLFNVVPTAVRNSEIQISAGRQSVFRRTNDKIRNIIKPHIELFQRKCFNIKELNKNPTMRTEFNEIDTVGIVFLIEPSVTEYETTKGQQFQNVYLTDVDKNFICINFWGGIKKFGYENIFVIGNIVACANLQKRAGNSRKSIPQYRATELTVFTKTPKLDYARNIIEELIKKMSGLDKRKFYDDCVSIKNNFKNIKLTAEYSPYRLNTSDYNLTRNKIFIDTPLVQSKDANLNLSGLDFESTFQQTDNQNLSPAALRRKQNVKDKINKLKKYGEPPPLSKIHIINKSKNAVSAYKSPLISDAVNVARTINTNYSSITTSKRTQSSPVLSSNRTFIVRCGVNPVKLNFSATSGGDKTECDNPFEEEFEASPPLSLD